MQKHKNKNICSPIDLIIFLSCNYATILNNKKIRGELTSGNNSDSSILFAQKGLEHEGNYLKKLKENGQEVIEISKNLNPEERIAKTNNAMKLGVDVIYQAALNNELWRGDSDFLIRCNKISQLGNYSYEVLDTKLSKRVEVKHIIQLCVYSELLSYVQGNMPKEMHLYLGDNQRYSFKITDYIYYYNSTKEEFLKFIRSSNQDLYPEPCNHCDLCEWKEYCAGKWKKDDHLSLVANITNSQREKLNKFGINTVKELAEIEEKTVIPNINKEVFSRLREQAILQNYKAITGKDKYQIISQSRGKGFERISKINPGDLFFDMEGDPLYPDGLEYLFGVYYKENNKEIFKTYWAHDHEEEKEAFVSFMDFVRAHLKKYPNAYIYHYNHYETTALKRLSCRYGVYEDQLDNLLRKKKFIDLYMVVRESIRTSEPGYSIKNLEVFYMDKRANTVATAADSIVVYNKWRETGEEKLLKEIADYNEIDCKSTYLLRNWLITLKPEDTSWFEGLGDNENPEEVKEEKKDWEKQYDEYKNKLENLYLENEEKNLMYLLEFHNREAKPQWWNIFDRQNKYESEIIEDVECLGGLKLIGEPQQEKRSLVYIYEYPEQETKLKKGSSIFNTETVEQVGSVIDIDEVKRHVKIKRGMAKEKLPQMLSVGPGGPIDSKLLRSAVYRFADKMIQSKDVNNCIIDLLKRSIPKIKGKNPGDAIIISDNLQNEVIQVIINMDRSYLFIQGPPGTGKTYISSHIIVELMKQGKRVGVTSNSHRAIHNLLSRIESVAKEKDFSFSGIKKASTSNKETYFEGSYIKNETKTNNISLEANLLAGTAWLFAHEYFVDQLDYLFIDEAGQVALANVVAMSTSTKNLILIGDQMQLGQPVQGTHPGDSGLSVLEYLLGNKSTIPIERGIFLSETRRLRPSICKFISETFYDGRLIAHKDTINRILNLKNCGLPNEGIKFIDVEHEGCSQKSIEEGNVINEIYNQLLDQEIDDSGMIRQITEKDILVVTPYNVQVNYLRSILPKNARVGTVDNFQGQEAPIVIISMVTSSAEYLPRNIEFLFSKNRLNVAISRAQCLAIIIANPKLLEVPCKTIEQMKMVNSFCRAYSES